MTTSHTIANIWDIASEISIAKGPKSSNSFKIIAHAWRRQATITRGAGTEESGAWEPNGQLIVWRLWSVTPTCATVKAT